MSDITTQEFRAPFKRILPKLWPHWSGALFIPIFVSLFLPGWLGVESQNQQILLIVGVVVGATALLYLLSRGARVKLVIDAGNGVLKVQNPVRSYRLASSDITKLTTGDVRVKSGGRTNAHINDYRCLAIDAKKSNMLTPSPIRVMASIDNDTYMTMSSAAQQFAAQFSIPQDIDIQAV